MVCKQLKSDSLGDLEDKDMETKEEKIVEQKRRF